MNSIQQIMILHIDTTTTPRARVRILRLLYFLGEKQENLARRRYRARREHHFTHMGKLVSRMEWF